MTKEGAYNILSDPAITESSELPIAVKALIALALAAKPKDEFPFREGQRVRYKHGGQMGTIVGQRVRRDGDREPSVLVLDWWEPV